MVSNEALLEATESPSARSGFAFGDPDGTPLSPISIIKKSQLWRNIKIKYNENTTLVMDTKLIETEIQIEAETAKQ